MQAYERTLRLAIARPAMLLVVSLLVMAAAFGGYKLLGSDLLPEMDEGGFIVDYIMPAGSSLQETNRVITTVEQILRSTPEVESTSRRTGLQLGLAAVTEAKHRRHRGQAETLTRIARVMKSSPTCARK